MVCSLSVNAIKAYAAYNGEKAKGSELGGKIGELERAVSDAVSTLDFEYSRLRERCESAAESLKYYYDLCSRKAEEIRSYYNDTPEKRTVRRTKTVEVINSDGSKGTKTEEYTVTYTDPNHNLLKQMLEQAEAAKREVDSLRSQCRECRKYLDDFDSAKAAFEKASQNAARVIGDIEKSMGEHLNSLAAQSMKAAEYIISAKAACGPLPAMRGDSGTVDLDGLGSYIRGLESKLNECTAEANKLVRAAGDLNSGWNDGVYTKFYNDTVSVRDAVAGIVKELENMKDALDGMYDNLESYAAVTPDINMRSIYFSYEPAGFPGRSSMHSVSAEMKI